MKEDVYDLLELLFAQTDKKYLCIRLSVFWDIFINHYPLRYQKMDKFIVTSGQLLHIVRDMRLCSPFKFKFKGKLPKRYKFTRKRLNDAKQLCF